MRYCILLLLPLLLSSSPLFAQCSDAGICSIGGQSSSVTHTIGIGYAYGRSTSADDLTFHSIGLEGIFQLQQDTRLSVTLPWSGQSGPLGSTSGIGDLIVVLDHRIHDDLPGQLNVQVGGKFATGAVNGSNLPQSYQSGLGTNDLLLGFSYALDSWSGSVGYQYSRGRSENRITRLKRGDDLLVRFGYTTDVHTTTAAFEILAIKRLEESSVFGFTTQSGEVFVAVPKSDQLQINFLGRFSVPLQEGTSLHSLLAFPFLNREVNVDGLTRALTLSLGVRLTL